MSPRAKVVGMGLMFLAPLAAALAVFFFFPQWWPGGRLNHGTLIDPARPLPAVTLVDETGQPAPTALQQKWSVVYLAGVRCAETCVERLRLVRQVRLRLSEKSERVQYVYVAPDPGALAAARAALALEHPAMLLLADAGPPGNRMADFLHPSDPDALYLLDPLGNWLMIYNGPVDPVGLLSDLKKLLQFSHIG